MSKEKVSNNMPSQKMTLKKKRRRNRTKKSIKKLFNQLRNETFNNSVIEIDDHSQNTVIHEDSLIIIPDDDDDANTSKIMTPRKNIYCLPSHSTPKPKSKLSIKDMIPSDTGHDIVLSTKSDSPTTQSATKVHKPLKSANTAHNMLNSVPVKEDIINLTKEINQDSYLTIDLTTDSSIRARNQTVIDLENLSEDSPQVSISNDSILSGESDVTVINMNNNKSKKKHMEKIANGINNLNSSEKGKLLEMITEKIFSGCHVPDEVKSSMNNMRHSTSKATETEEDIYIKQIILKQSRNSIGSNIYNPEKPRIRPGPRMIVIDGSNVAMGHGGGQIFSVKGLKICIDFFLMRGHVVKAFVPRFRCKAGKSSDPKLLDYLMRQGWVIYTPSREIKGKTITPYDDRYIVQCAAEFDAVIVTGDNYRDLIDENPRWRPVIENRILPFTWVQDMIMFPRDPLGGIGPTLEMFLMHPHRPH